MGSGHAVADSMIVGTAAWMSMPQPAVGAAGMSAVASVIGHASYRRRRSGVIKEQLITNALLTSVDCTTDSFHGHYSPHCPECLIYFLLYRVSGRPFGTLRSLPAEPFPSTPSTDLPRINTCVPARPVA